LVWFERNAAMDYPSPALAMVIAMGVLGLVLVVFGH
jgi:hypothetical protein